MNRQPKTLAPELPANVETLVNAIAAAGGKPVLIGGAVRDRLLGLAIKDIDIEVYGLPLAALMAALERIATVHAVGKSFGILKVNYCGTEVDISLPRRERKVGRGHRDFAVQSDPYLPFREAASRRDFTINAMGIELPGNTLLDPWHGVADLHQGTIRHITDAFDEDPLRVLRACQFAARFEFRIAPETLAKCRALQSELRFLSRERIWEELKKLLLKAHRPALGIEALAGTGAIVLFPELAELCANQRELWTHSNQILDKIAAICAGRRLAEGDRLALLLAGLCLRFRSSPDSARRTEDFLQQCGCPQYLRKTVPALALHAEYPLQLWRQHNSGAETDSAIRRLALKAPLRHLCLLASALVQSSAPEAQAPPWLLRNAERLGVVEHAPQPLLLGRHLLALGLHPGVAFKKILDAAFEAQLNGAFDNEAQAKQWLAQQLALTPSELTTARRLS